MDWSRFSFAYRLDLAGMHRPLVAIEGSKEAAKNLLLPPEWRKRLDALNRIRTVHGSTALEGNPLSEDQVADFLQRSDRGTPDQRSFRQIHNADVAQSWVRDRFGPGRPPMALADIMRMHALLTQHSDQVNNVPGTLRTHRVQVGSPELGGVHRGAPHKDLRRLMAEFVDFVNSRRQRSEHAVVRALLAHFFLVTIHPFGDGNGRVSRLVEAAILYEGGYNVNGFYGLSNYFYRNGDEYKRRLQECRRTRPFDLAPFVEFGLSGFEEELRGINSFIKTKLNRLVYRDILTRARRARVSTRRHLLNAREFALLDHLLIETEPADPFADNPTRAIRLADLVVSAYVQGAYRDVTDRTFVREVQRLAKLGFIKMERDSESGRATVAIDFRATEMDLEAVAPF